MSPPPVSDESRDGRPHVGDPPRKPPKERRLARHARHARMLWNEPRSAGGIARESLLRVWRARGGGLYGLGYVVAFLVLEIRLVVSEFQGSESLMSFLSDQLLEYVLRLGVMSFVNVLLAFLWPVFVLEHLGGWGLLVLAGGFFLFERLLRPRVEAVLPELRRPPGRPRAATTAVLRRTEPPATRCPAASPCRLLHGPVTLPVCLNRGFP